MKASRPRHWLVVGGGLSGKGCANYLRHLDNDVVLYDDKPLPEALKRELEKINVRVVTGKWDSDLFSDRDAVALSPGVPLTHPLIVACENAGLPRVSEIDLALDDYKGKIVGITGTNGKSTTCAMTAHILEALGNDAAAAGNIGDPPSLFLAQDIRPSTFVLELSSYQLEHSSRLRCDVAIFHNFSFDHLERHKTMGAYFAMKWRLINWVRNGGRAFVTNDILALAQKFGEALPPESLLTIIRTPYDQEKPVEGFPSFILSSDLLLKMKDKTFDLSGFGLSYHNVLNGVMATLAATTIVKHDFLSAFGLLKNFKNLPFRFEVIGEWKGMRFINDSKATNVDATLTALQNVMDRKVILLLGGIGKGESYAPILRYQERIHKVLCFGKSGPAIMSELQDELSCLLYPTLRDLLKDLSKQVSKNSYDVLFSPACASFDEFKNFEDRGRFFSEQVSGIIKS